MYVSGPREAPPLVLVHGYPDSAAVWEPLRAQLDRHYRVITYDVRGAGASDAPPRRAGYRLERLAADLAAVADATCAGWAFHLVGHDWGSIQSWEAVTSAAFEGRIASFTSISGPCLDHAALGLRGHARDILRAARRAVVRERSAANAEVLVHLRVSSADLAGTRMALAAMARGWPLWLRVSEHVRAERDPAQLRNGINGLNLYRANFIDRLFHPRARRAHAPVQFIVPLRDRYVGPALSLGLEKWLGDYTRETIDAGHWVVLRDPVDIAARIDRFAAQHPPRGRSDGVSAFAASA